MFRCEQFIDDDVKARAVPDVPIEHVLPDMWSLSYNAEAFLTPDDWQHARRLELSGSLDFWLNEDENVFDQE